MMLRVLRAGMKLGQSSGTQGEPAEGTDFSVTWCF